jgi:hypothetical protein
MTIQMIELHGIGMCEKIFDPKDVPTLERGRE